MTEIFDSGSLPPKELDAYKTDFARGSKILKEASQEYYKTTEEHKKKQLEKSMKETITAMNEILNNVLHEKGKTLEDNISKDYQNFIANANPDTMKHLNKDVDDAKNAL